MCFYDVCLYSPMLLYDFCFYCLYACLLCIIKNKLVNSIVPLCTVSNVWSILCDKWLNKFSMSSETPAKCNGWYLLQCNLLACSTTVLNVVCVSYMANKDKYYLYLQGLHAAEASQCRGCFTVVQCAFDCTA